MALAWDAFLRYAKGRRARRSCGKDAIARSPWKAR
jgi:hypothetical protein